jgi:hypothetical protein
VRLSDAEWRRIITDADHRLAKSASFSLSRRS